MKPRRGVIHLETGKIYESLADAERDTGKNRGYICTHAKKNDGIWAYVDTLAMTSIR